MVTITNILNFHFQLMMVIQIVFEDAIGQYILTVSKQYDYVFVGDRPAYTCSVYANVHFLIENPLKWERIKHDGSTLLISHLATVQPGLEHEYTVESKSTDNEVSFTLNFSQGVKKNYDGQWRCVLYDKLNILLAERKVEIHVIQLFDRMEFQIGNTTNDLLGIKPFPLSLEEGSYNSVCKTWGSNPAAAVKIYLDNTELIGKPQVAVVDTKEAVPPNVYNVEKRNTINLFSSDKNKILKCMSVVYNDTVMNEDISFKLHIYRHEEANPVIKCENVSAFHGDRHVSLTCYIKLDGIRCGDNIYWENLKTGEKFKREGEGKSYWVVCKEEPNSPEVTSTLYIDTVTERDFRANYVIVYVTNVMSVTRLQAILYQDELYVKQYTTVNICCPLIPDKNENISWIYEEKVIAIQNNINPEINWRNKISVVHNFTERKFILQLSNFTVEDQGIYRCSSVVKGKHKGHLISMHICNIPDNYEFIQFPTKSKNSLSSGTTSFCTIELNYQPSTIYQSDILFSGTFKLTIPVQRGQFKRNLHDRHTKDELFTCLVLNEEYCTINNKTLLVNLEWISRNLNAAMKTNGIQMYTYSCYCNWSNNDDNPNCNFSETAYKENSYLHLMDFKLSTAVIYYCTIISIDTVTVLLDLRETNNPILKHVGVGIAAVFAVVITIAAVVIIGASSRSQSESVNSSTPHESIPSTLSEDREDVSVYHEYEDVESVSINTLHIDNERNYSFEPSNQLITSNIDDERIPYNVSPSRSSGNTITLLHFYVNTNISNTDPHLNMSARNENDSNHSNESESFNIYTDNRLSNDSSGSEILQVHQYVNVANPAIPNTYEDLKNTTTDTHKYETLQQDI